MNEMPHTLPSATQPTITAAATGAAGATTTSDPAHYSNNYNNCSVEVKQQQQKQQKQSPADDLCDVAMAQLNNAAYSTAAHADPMQLLLCATDVHGHMARMHQARPCYHHPATYPAPGYPCPPTQQHPVPYPPPPPHHALPPPPHLHHHQHQYTTYPYTQYWFSEPAAYYYPPPPPPQPQPPFSHPHHTSAINLLSILASDRAALPTPPDSTAVSPLPHSQSRKKSAIVTMKVPVQDHLPPLQPPPDEHDENMDTESEAEENYDEKDEEKRKEVASLIGRVHGDVHYATAAGSVIKDKEPTESRVNEVKEKESVKEVRQETRKRKERVSSVVTMENEQDDHQDQKFAENDLCTTECISVEREQGQDGVFLVRMSDGTILRTHVIDGKVPCPMDGCTKAFSEHYNLKSHMRSHSGIRPYQCEQCGMSFSRSHDLTRHRRLHSGERPYMCEFCGRRFTRRDAAKRHQQNRQCSRRRKEYLPRLAAVRDHDEESSSQSN